MKPLCLLLLPDAADQPAAWWRLHDGQSAHGQLLPDEPLPPGPAGEQVVVATVGAQVGVHWASLDAHTPAQARVAAASTLAPQLIPPAAGLHIAACRDGQHWQLLVCDPDWLDQLLQRLQRQAIQPAQLLPASLLLPVASDGEGVLACHQQVWLWRQQQLAIAAEPALVQQWLPAGSAEPQALASLIDLQQQLPTANLLQGRFAPGQSATTPLAGRRLLVALAALLLCLPLAIAGHGVGTRWQAASLERASLALARQQHPAGAAAAAPLQAIEQLAARQQQRQQQWDLLQRSLAAVHDTPGLAIEQLALEHGQLRLQFQPGQQAALPAWQQQLQQQHIDARPSPDSGAGTTLILQQQARP